MLLKSWMELSSMVKKSSSLKRQKVADFLMEDQGPAIQDPDHVAPQDLLEALAKKFTPNQEEKGKFLN